ncbi:MAG TPA: hypothetical protein VJB14_09170, partial [Planctomycetota bacterium]|nr:hypothetical protein [Planctomycetota bacterium]
MRRAFLVLVLAASCARGAHEPGAPPAESPLDPIRARSAFRLSPGFAIDLAASEPDVVDPVAMAFDERGRLYVAE